MSIRELEGKRVLLTGGRAPAALELARLLAAAGCVVTSAESASHPLCRVSRAVKASFRVPSPAAGPAAYGRALEELVIREDIQHLLPTCEEIFYIAASRERLARHCQVFAPPLEQLRRLHSKARFIETAADYGYAVPLTAVISSAGEWEAFARSASFEAMLEAGGCVLKPEYSRFASKVAILRSAQKLRDLVPGLHHGTYPWVAQQYIEGRELCTYSVAHQGRVTAHAAYASELSAYGGATMHFEPLAHPAAQEWAGRFAMLEGYTGQLAFDFIETAEGQLYPIECNPRTTSGIHLLAGAPGMAAALLRPESLLTAVPVQPQPDKRAMLALPLLAAGLSGRLRGRPGRHWLRRWLGARDVTFRWTDPRPGVEQLLLAMDLQRTAKARGISLVEAST